MKGYTPLGKGSAAWNSTHLVRISLLMSESLDAILFLFLVGLLTAATLPIGSYRTLHSSNVDGSHPATFPNLPVPLRNSL